MGSLLRRDKIGNLSEAGGTISLAPSILTIGGRQYETTSSINVALPSLTANSRYQVFAVQTAGVVSLVVSQNENSQGPNGYSGWRVVGAFYTDNGSNFLFFADEAVNDYKGIVNNSTIIYESEPFIDNLAPGGSGNEVINFLTDLFSVAPQVEALCFSTSGSELDGVQINGLDATFVTLKHQSTSPTTQGFTTNVEHHFTITRRGSDRKPKLTLEELERK